MTAVKTPDRYKFSVQPGCILVNQKYNSDSNMKDKLKSFFNEIKMQDLGDYDFILPNHKIVYISEKKLLTDLDTSKLKTLHKPIVIADRNIVTIDVYAKLQNILSGNDITLFPVGHCGELPLLIHQISLAHEIYSPGSDFRQNRKNPSDIQQQILLTVPGLGPTKATALIKKFGTVQKVALASLNELTSTIGSSSASQVHRYFNGLINS